MASLLLKFAYSISVLGVFVSIPIQYPFTSGVAGADLLQLSEQELINDVKLTPFAARKIVKARDSFLVSGRVF